VYTSTTNHMEMEIMFHDIKTVKVVSTTSIGFVSHDLALHNEDDNALTTLVAALKAPFSYDDEINRSNIINEEPRKMQRDPTERLSENYHWTTQEGSRIPMSDRVDLVWWMYAFTMFHDLPPDMLHHVVNMLDHVVNYVDLFMLSNKIIGGRLYLLGG
jgi:hypothetical protein